MGLKRPPSGENGELGDIMALRLASEGEPMRCPCCGIIICGDQPCGDGIDIEARGLYLDVNEGGMPGRAGLPVPDDGPRPWKGKPGRPPPLAAEDVGSGGEKGSGG